jgi:hypothetical protein
LRDDHFERETEIGKEGEEKAKKEVKRREKKMGTIGSLLVLLVFDIMQRRDSCKYINYYCAKKLEVFWVN